MIILAIWALLAFTNVFVLFSDQKSSYLATTFPFQTIAKASAHARCTQNRRVCANVTRQIYYVIRSYRSSISRTAETQHRKLRWAYNQINFFSYRIINYYIKIFNVYDICFSPDFSPFFFFIISWIRISWTLKYTYIYNNRWLEISKLLSSYSWIYRIMCTCQYLYR